MRTLLLKRLERRPLETNEKASCMPKPFSLPFVVILNPLAEASVSLLTLYSLRDHATAKKQCVPKREIVTEREKKGVSEIERDRGRKREEERESKRERERDCERERERGEWERENESGHQK